MAGLTKQKIRSKILLRLKIQKEEDRERKSRVIQKKLFGAQEFKKAKLVMFYVSFNGEVNTRQMIKEALKLGKTVAVPLCRKNTISPCLWETDTVLKRGAYGVAEPAMKKVLRLRDLDLVIVPGIAFNRKGQRLGRGRGCYDSFLKRLCPSTASIGLAFDFQILPDIPTTRRDTSVNRVIFA